MSLYDGIPLHPGTASIRLLELHGFHDQNDQDMVQGSLVTYKLSSKLDYDALSYAWGAQDTSHSITLNDQVFKVSPNLHAALFELRSRQARAGNTRRLWIDAISISQIDHAEKSQQVLMMHQIYACAATVLMWVGNANGFSELAFDTLERFAVDDALLDGTAIAQKSRSTIDERRAAIASFVRSAYFTRMWVVQEIILAKEALIICGGHSIRFEVVHLALRRLTASGFVPLEWQLTNIVYVGNWRAARSAKDVAHEDRLAIEDGEFDLRLFLDIRDRLTTDPRDRLYALRGIASQRLVEGIDVDYDKHVARAYVDFAKHVLRVRSDLSILSAVIRRRRILSELKLPSYVPDWTVPCYGRGILQRYYRFSKKLLFRAAGNSRSKVTLDENSDV